jgi:glycosyltransferase involved in cell wall biosynthesis
VKKPTVAILTNYPYDGASFSGGVETASAGLLEGLTPYAGEFDFHIMALSRDVHDHVREKRNGMTFHFLAIPSAWYARPHVIPNVVHARAELKKLQPDLIHCQDNMALAMGAMSVQNTKKLFTVHGIKSVESRVWQGPEYWSHQMDAMLERWARQHFNEVITISPYVDRFLPAHVRKHHVPNPVRKLFFEQPQSGSNGHHVLVVGVLTRLKRPLDVLQAFAILKRQDADARLTLVGEAEDTEYHREMRHFVERQHLSDVEFAGRRSPAEIAVLMRQASVLVLASVQENSPMVIAEAMASGLPVLASRVGGVPLMVEDGVDGVLFDCGNVEQLATMLREVLRDAALRGKLSRNGRAKALRRYSSESVGAATVNIYRNVLGM